MTNLSKIYAMYVKFYMFANMYVHLILVSMSKYAIYALIYEFMHYFTSASQMTSHYNMICLIKIFSGTKSILFTTEKKHVIDAQKNIVIYLITYKLCIFLKSLITYILCIFFKRVESDNKKLQIAKQEE